jgi:RNA polymerase sigma-70 factor (ECF subfamily)
LNNEINVLLIAIKNANDSSFEILFKKMHKSVFALAFSILGDKSLAEDVVQETFIRIKTKSNSYLEGTNGVAWIFQIARNLSLNILKKRKFEVTILKDNQSLEELFLKHSPSSNKSKEFDISLEKFLLQEAFTKLNENERQIVILYAVSGLKHKEIAKLLNIPQPTERWYYIRALGKLRKTLSAQITCEME